MGYEEFHHLGGGINNVLDSSKNKLEDGNGVLMVVTTLHVLVFLHHNPCTLHRRMI